MHAEEQRACVCGHRKKNHELPRVEGGHGGGDSGRCVTYSCPCMHFEPIDGFIEQEYVGEPMPKWVAEGVKVKVKSTPDVKKDGVGYGNDILWGGEVGVIEKADGTAWWDWSVRFDRGRTHRLDEDFFEKLARVRR